MDIRQRVLEARLAEKASKNPALAKELGITVVYKQTGSDQNKTKK